MRIDEVLVYEERLNAKPIISAAIIKLDKVFKNNKHEMRIVGGAVRDIALGKSPKDIDFATDATPDEMMKILDRAGIRHKPTGLEHGTITAILDNEPFEITTLRADTETDGRHAKVEFVKSWEEDAKRRDLTYNAMSMDIEGNVYDYFGGMDDLQDKVSKFVGDAEERITEDYLRILRYFRFQGRLSKPTWDGDTLEAITKHAKGLSGISAERIWAEMGKVLSGQNVASVVSMIEKTGVSKVIGLSTNNANTLKDKSNPVLALAQLDNSVDLAKRWKFSNNETQLLDFLVKNKNNPLDQKKVEDMIADGVDKDLISALATLQGKKVNTDAEVPNFPLTGADLIAKGMKPGPEMGAKLGQLKQKWKASNFTATKDDLLKENIKSLFEDLDPKSELYVDMDGVLADFFGVWNKMMGVKHWKDIPDIDKALQKIKDTDDFWINLPMTPNGKNLLNAIKQFKGKYNILSAPLPGDPNSEPQKRAWIRKHLGMFPPAKIIIDHNKAAYAKQADGTPNALIDDFGENISKWRSAGGVGIQHKDIEVGDTISKLAKELEDGQEPVNEAIEMKISDLTISDAGMAIAQSVGGGSRTDAPLAVTKLPSGHVYLVNGYHRLVDAMQAGKDTVSVEYVPYEKVEILWKQEREQDIKYGKQFNENFADGKVKGKSRPGRVKKSGASCNGSVTELRAKAKKASGEKAKMYHWCANMKGGKKK
jgi:tRNA nucleotidyltransferase (CCA-adding enzyme)